jgi:hypothetical protein
MKKSPAEKIKGNLLVRTLKIFFFIAGGFLLYRNKEKVLSFVRSQNFIITAAYAIIISFIALVARLIMALNWILQQAR